MVPTTWLPNSSEVVLRLTLLTLWVAAADALPVTLPSPEYVAVRVRVPPVWNVIVQAPAVGAAEQVSPVLALYRHGARHCRSRELRRNRVPDGHDLPDDRRIRAGWKRSPSCWWPCRW